MFTAVFAYQVEPALVDAFEAAYGPGGRWSMLFEGEPGYLSTELLADDERPGRYLVLDRWVSAATYAVFLRDRGAEYAALGDACAHLYVSETRIGRFSSGMLPG